MPVLLPSTNQKKMKPRRRYSVHRLSRDAERLVWLAKGLADSGSRSEDAWWEAELAAHIRKILDARQEEALNQSLDSLHETHAHAYDELADLIEAGVEGDVVSGTDGPWRTVLLALPVMAWSRYSIPARTLPNGLLDGLRVQLKAHVLAEGCRVALADFLFSPDQLPHGYAETRRLATELSQAALIEADVPVASASLPETGHYISDLRYVLASVATPLDHPILRWQEADGSRETAQEQWQKQATPSVQAAMTGCTVQLLLPDAYFSAWRRADRDSRSFALAATAAYLQAAMNIPSTSLRAVAAPYYEHRLVEWRIGFSLADDDQILHGVVWPLLGSEDEASDVSGEIEAVLKQAGVGRIVILDQHLAVEYCDDCGAPFFPNVDGESVHSEMPEADADLPPMHLH